MNFCYECVYLWYTQYFISIKFFKNSYACGQKLDKLSFIFYYSYNDIGYNNWESVHLLHVHLLHWFYYSIHRHKSRRAGSLVVVGCAGCCHSDTSRRVADGGVGVAWAFYFGASFLCVFDRASHLITSNCISELMKFMCVYAYMYVLYVIPQYHVLIVYINPITTFILYIITFYSMFYAFDAIMFYCTLSEMTRIKMINQSIDLYQHGSLITFSVKGGIKLRINSLTSTV